MKVTTKNFSSDKVKSEIEKLWNSMPKDRVYNKSRALELYRGNKKLAEEFMNGSEELIIAPYNSSPKSKQNFKIINKIGYIIRDNATGDDPNIYDNYFVDFSDDFIPVIRRYASKEDIENVLSKIK